MSIILDVVFAFVLTYLSFLLLSLGNKKHAGITRLTSTPSPLLLIVLHSLAYLGMDRAFTACKRDGFSNVYLFTYPLHRGVQLPVACGFLGASFG